MYLVNILKAAYIPIGKQMTRFYFNDVHTKRNKISDQISERDLIASIAVLFIITLYHFQLVKLKSNKNTNKDTTTKTKTMKICLLRKHIRLKSYDEITSTRYKFLVKAPVVSILHPSKLLSCNALHTHSWNLNLCTMFPSSDAPTYLSSLAIAGGYAENIAKNLHENWYANWRYSP